MGREPIHDFRASWDERLEWMPVQMRSGAAAIKSGLRRTTIFCLKRARVDRADTLNWDWLYIVGGIDNQTGLWHKALAQ
jgi:hypothetical protein